MGQGKWHGGRKRVNAGNSRGHSVIRTDRAGVCGRRVVDKARMAEGHAVRALKYQAMSLFLKKEIKESLEFLTEALEDGLAVLRKMTLVGEGKGSRRRGDWC